MNITRQYAKRLLRAPRLHFVVFNQPFWFLGIAPDCRWFRTRPRVCRPGGCRLQSEIRCDLLRNALSRPTAHTLSSPLPFLPGALPSGRLSVFPALPVGVTQCWVAEVPSPLAFWQATRAKSSTTSRKARECVCLPSHADSFQRPDY